MNAIDYWYKKYMALKETERIQKPELTWEDMRRIIRIDEEMMDDPEAHPEWMEEQPFYEEMLRRFMQIKEAKK